MSILNIFKLFLGVPGSLLDVKVIPNTVLMLITWREIENNDTFPIINITIKYRIIHDGIANDDWNVVQVNPSKVKH